MSPAVVDWLVGVLARRLARKAAPEFWQGEDAPIYGVGMSYLETLLRPHAERASARVIARRGEARLFERLARRSRAPLAPRAELAAEGAAEPCDAAPADAETRRFFEKGYWIAPDLFADRVAELRSEVSRLRSAGLLTDVSTRAHASALQLGRATQHSALLREIACDPRLVDVVERWIGSPVFLHLDQLFTKPARVGRGTSWHQDSAYFRLPDNRRGLSVWIAIDAATRDNGTLRLVPGSHRTALPHRADSRAANQLYCDPEPSQPTVCELPAGGAVFFLYGTLHCTGPNPTAHDRTALALHYLHASVALQDRLPGRAYSGSWIQSSAAR